MPKYRLYVQEVYDVWYDIETEDEDEAWEAYYNGELIESGREFSNMVDGTEELLKDPDGPVVQDKAVWDEIAKRYKVLGGDEEDIV